MNTHSIYDEGPVPVMFEGRIFTADGARVTDSACAAYLGEAGQLTDCAGKVIGSYRITARWRTPRSWVSSEQCQVRATIDGRTYNGRSAGVGMLFRGRRAAAELRRAERSASPRLPRSEA